MNEIGDLSVIIGALAIILLVFLLLREFWCWYWKVNKIVSLQKETNELLKSLVENNRRETQHQTTELDEYEL